MKRREVLLVLLVVGPFLALVLVALWPSAGPPSPAPAPAPRPGPVAPVAPAPAVAASPPVTPSPAPALRPAPSAAATDEAPWPRALAAPLRAVTPEVMRCFEDHRAHLHDVQRLEVRFRPLPDGGFADVRVPSTGNPWIAACVEDVFEELGFVPSGAETFELATHRFAYDPDAGARP